MLFNPFEQFEIVLLGLFGYKDFDLSLTNLYCLPSFVLIISLIVVKMNLSKKKYLNYVVSILVEIFYLMNSIFLFPIIKIVAPMKVMVDYFTRKSFNEILSDMVLHICFIFKFPIGILMKEHKHIKHNIKS